MKIFIVIDETFFFHPQMLFYLIGQLNKDHSVVGIARVVSVPEKTSLERYLRLNWRYLRFSELAKLVLLKWWYLFLDNSVALTRKGVPYSVKSVVRAYNIPSIDVHKNINTRESLMFIKDCNPDLIISSNSLVFKEELLTLPRIACINRHSSLLPAYGGIWPVFQAYRCGEKFVGVTVHTMTKDIDRGIVLSQRKIPISSGDSIFDLYKKCFEESITVILEAVEKISRNNFSDVREFTVMESYFSQPRPEHWQDFRRLGGRFI